MLWKRKNKTPKSMTAKEARRISDGCKEELVKRIDKEIKRQCDDFKKSAKVKFPSLTLKSQEELKKHYSKLGFICSIKHPVGIADKFTVEIHW